MSRSVFVAVSTVVMLVLALVVVRLFREPEPVASLPPLASQEADSAGASVSGPLNQEEQPGLALPPASAMVMSSGDTKLEQANNETGKNSGQGEKLAVSVAASGDDSDSAFSQAGTLVRDAPPTALTVTEAPAAPVPPSAAGSVSGPSSGPASATDMAAVVSDMSKQAASGKNSEKATEKAAGKSTENAASQPKTASADKAAPAPSSVKSAPVQEAPQPDGALATNKAKEEKLPNTPASAPSVNPSGKPAVDFVATPAANSTEEPAAKPLKPGTLVTKSSLTAKAGTPTVQSATLTMDGDVVTLRLEASQSVNAKSFILKEPDRVVLDLSGHWSMEAPRVPSNRMLKSLRVGEQAKATRVVFDMKVTPTKASVSQVSDNVVELRIR